MTLDELLHGLPGVAYLGLLNDRGVGLPILHRPMPPSTMTRQRRRHEARKRAQNP